MGSAPFRDAFGKRLRRLLELKGMSGRQFSIRTTIAQCHVSRYMTGKRSPGLDCLYRMARVLEVSVSVLVPDNLLTDPLGGTEGVFPKSNPDETTSPTESTA